MTSTDKTMSDVWDGAKASAVRVVTAPGKRFCVETAYQSNGSRVVRTECHGDGYVTVATYSR